MKLTPFTIKHLAKMIAGDTTGWPYRSGPDLVRFFNEYGFRDVYEQGFPTRYMFAEEKLKALNNKDVLKDVFKDMLDSRNWNSCTPIFKCCAGHAMPINQLTMAKIGKRW